MHCPICSIEMQSDSISCEACGATRLTQRTPLGVLVGWLGLTMLLLSLMMALFLLALFIFGHDLSGFPWAAQISSFVVAGGLLYYSKSTLHATWVRRDN